MECPDTEHAHCPDPNCGVPLTDEEFPDHVENAHSLSEWVNSVTWATMVMSEIRDVLDDHPKALAEIDRRIAVLHAEVDADLRRN